MSGLNKQLLFVWCCYMFTIAVAFREEKIARNFTERTHKETIQSSGTATEEPFTAYWNVPSYSCQQLFNISLNLDKYGIIANKGENFTGDEVVIFYKDEFGYYPYLNGSKPINGGLPQVADLEGHLEKATEDVIAKIPDPAFDGVAVLDWEAWRPQWVQNFDSKDIYRKQSIQHVRERHPDWSNETVELVAVLEFEQAAKQFMESSLRLVTELRPNGQWGFYHFPYCYNEKQPGRVCSSEAMTSNDNITWLFDASTALYPSIYLPGVQDKLREYVSGRISEALRVRKESKNHYTDIYPYTRYVYRKSELYLTKQALNLTILQSAELGCSGVVFWGSNIDYHTAESCTHLQSYIKQLLGPFVKNVTDASVKCSNLLCSGNGRCIGDIMGCAATPGNLRNDQEDANRMEGRKSASTPLLFPCTCDCYKGWSGPSCIQSAGVGH